MKTTEEEEQQNEIKLAYERNGMDKQTKNIQKWSKNTYNIQQRHNFTKKLVISVKNVNAQFLFPSTISGFTNFLYLVLLT